MNSAVQKLPHRHDAVVLITGGSGFVGSHLIELLLELGYTAVHTTCYGQTPEWLTQRLPPEHIHRLNLTDYQATSQLLTQLQPDHLYHLAAFASVGDSFERAADILQNNLLLQLSILEAIRHHAPKCRMLTIGSGMEYDFIGTNQPTEPAHERTPLGPANPYGVSKVTQDLLSLSYVYSYRLDVVRARPFNHIGERQTNDFAIAAFARQIVMIERREQTELLVGNLEAIRDFTDVKDVVAAYIMLMYQGTTGEVYNVGSGQGLSIKAVLAQMCQLADTTITVRTDADRLRPSDVPYAVADSSKIEALGWKREIPLTVTLERILHYWRSLS